MVAQDLNLEIEDQSPEMYSAHIIRMYEQALAGDFAECHKAITFANRVKTSPAALAAAKAAAATEAFHEGGAGGSSGGREASTMSSSVARFTTPFREWEMVGQVKCHDMHMHNESGRSHGNSVAASQGKHSKAMRRATKRQTKQTRQKSSWNKN